MLYDMIPDWSQHLLFLFDKDSGGWMEVSTISIFYSDLFDAYLTTKDIIPPGLYGIADGMKG